jgi:hypothetical protein
MRYDIDDKSPSLELKVDCAGERVGDGACHDNNIGTGAASRFPSPPLSLCVSSLRIDYGADRTSDYKCDNCSAESAIP